MQAVLGTDFRIFFSKTEKKGEAAEAAEKKFRRKRASQLAPSSLQGVILAGVSGSLPAR